MQLKLRLPLALLSFCALWISSVSSAPAIRAENSLVSSTHNNSNLAENFFQDDGLDHLSRRNLPASIANWNLYQAWVIKARDYPLKVRSIPENIDMGQLSGTNKFTFLHDNQLVGINLIQKLGSGTFGSVYRADYVMKKTGQSLKVAAKVSKGNDNGRLLYGARIQLNLASISNFIAGPIMNRFWAQTTDQAVMIMHIADSDLHSQLYQIDRTLTQPHKSALFKGILTGVLHIHTPIDIFPNGVIHRDLKPANVLMYKGIPKIADFDSATTDSKSHELSIGTPGYVAPEVIRGDEYGKGVDIFALGMLYVELFFPGMRGEPLNRLWIDLVSSRGTQDWHPPNTVVEILTKHLVQNIHTGVNFNQLMFLSNLLCKPSHRFNINFVIKAFDLL